MTQSKGHGRVKFNSEAQMVLWPASDFEKLQRYYFRLNKKTHDVSQKSLHARQLFHKYVFSKEESDRLNYERAKNDAEDEQTVLDQLIKKLEFQTSNYRYADKKNGFEITNNQVVYPDKIIIEKNSLVNPALKVYAQQIANAGTEEFRYIASGKSSLPTTPEMNRLIDENSRLDIFVNGGYRNPNGDIVREGVIFPPALDDALIKEFGSFTSPQFDSGTMQWRNVIETPSEQLQHDQGQTFYSIAHATILEITFIE